MNKVEQAVCRIREKLPDNQGFVTLGVGCVVKNEQLATSLGWKCPNLIVTSSAVITPEHLDLDKIFLAEFLVFEKKGFEVFDLKLATEFCKTISSRALSEEEEQQLPNERLTVISTEPLDKRGFLKRMVKKSSLQTTRPIDCFDFQNFDNELSMEGIFCNVIREFGSLAQEFETRTYKFKRNEENHRYFLEDFGQQPVELDEQRFPDDQKPLGGVIFSKLGAYVGCLGYATTQIEPSFLPSSYFQAAETKEETQLEEEEKKETELLVEGATTVDNTNEVDKLPIDENKNEEQQGVSTEKNEDIPLEDTDEKTTPEEKEDTSLGEQTSQSNEQEELRAEVHEGEETQSEKESCESSEIIDTEKGVSGEEAFTECPESSEAVEQNTLKEMNNESEVSGTVEEYVDVNKEVDGSQQEFVTPTEGSEKEIQKDDDTSETEKNNLEGGEDLIAQDTETGSFNDKEKDEISNDIKESFQEINNELSVSEENKDVSEQADVAMETNKHFDEGIGDEPNTDKKLESDVSLVTVEEVESSQAIVTHDEDGVTEIRDTSEAGKESNLVAKNADIETDQVNTSNQAVVTDEGKVNEVKSVMAEDNVLDNTNEAGNAQNKETIKLIPAPTLEEELDMKLFQKRRESKSEEARTQGMKEEEVESQQEKEKTLDKDSDISSEIITEKKRNLKEKSLVDNESNKTEETLINDKPDGSGQEVEVLKLDPTQSPSPRKAQYDVGESLEPDALLSATITNNPKVLDDLAILLDTEYQHGGVASWHDMALLLDIPKEAFDHCLSYSKSSPTESLMMFLSNTKPQFTISDLKDSLRSIGRADVVHILDRYIARSIVSDESVILGVVEREDTDLLGELALKLDRSGPQNWKSLASQLEVPRRISKHFGSQQRQNPALLMLKYLPIFDPDLTVQSLKDACEAINKFDVVKFLDTSGVPGDDAIMDILEDTDIIDEVSDMLNDDEVVPNWKDLAKELKIPEVKFTIFEPAEKKSPTKLLLQSIEQCEPDLTVEELILALVAMKRHDVIDMLCKHFKRSDVRSILEENNCLPPEPEPKDEGENNEDDDGAESFA